ncbi:RAD55 family ATPase [Fibrobacterota bacterium]
MMAAVDSTNARVTTGCKELDIMLNGGLLTGSANLLEGAAGTGKSTLGVQFLMDGMKQGENGLVITFEEFPEQYYDYAMELGWDLRDMESKGLLDIIFTTPDEFMNLIYEEDNRLTQIIEEKSVKRALVDSVTNLEKLARDLGELREIETDLVNYFKREEITTILLKENSSILGGWNISKNKIPFIVDSYIILRYLELESQIKRGLMVLKMRGSNHTKEIRQYEIGKNGVSIGNTFQGISGLFLGTGRPVQVPKK